MIKLLFVIYLFNSQALAQVTKPEYCLENNIRPCWVSATQDYFKIVLKNADIYISKGSSFVINSAQTISLVKGKILINAKEQVTINQQDQMIVEAEQGMIILDKNKTQYKMLQIIGHSKINYNGELFLQEGMEWEQELLEKSEVSVFKPAKIESLVALSRALKPWAPSELKTILKAWSHRAERASEVYREVASVYESEVRQKQDIKDERKKKFNLENEKFKNMMKMRFYEPDQWLDVIDSE